MKFTRLLLSLSLIGAFSFNTIFANSYSTMQSKLGESFRNSADPYADEYIKKDPLTRFPALQSQNENLWMFDNFRNSTLKCRKGDILENGEKCKKAKMKISWTSALVDINKVKKVSLVMTTFNTKIGPIKMQTGHAQMLFEFESGGVMTPEGPVDSLVNSYEGYRDKGTIFNPIKGMRDAYDSIMVLGTFSDVMLKALTIFNGIQIYELNFTKEQMKIALTNTLAISTNREKLAKKKYHTTRNSCVTNQVEIINSALPEEKRIKEWHTFLGARTFRTLYSILPGKIPKTLRKAGLMKSEISRVGRERMLEYYDEYQKTKNVKLQQYRVFNSLYN
ncbi:MAG: hypothetical protein COB02_07480 [Candidatus Cloacimonadota bacterium]|nr:MAG: hypothetical protein COB02_07480 [Candidatus Cloacimonadota bacterium]